MSTNIITILYINQDKNESNFVVDILSKYEQAKFQTIVLESAENALEYLSQNKKIDIIITNDILPGMNGINFIKKAKELDYNIPIVFLTSDYDINLAVEVMRLGAKDCLLKSEINNTIFPQSLIQVIEKSRLKQDLLELEIKQKRLEAMQEIIVSISDKISEPLEEMKKIVATLEQSSLPKKAENFLILMKDNIERVQTKLEQLRNLKDDKTVKYIRDIKMIDLS